MISPIDRWTSKPNVAEKVAFDTSIAGDPNQFITVLRDIPCGFAKTIEVFFLCTSQPIQHIVVRSYAANRSLFVDTQITGAIVANTTTSVAFSGPFGQSYDVRVQLKNGAATPFGTVATVWSCARA